MNLAALWKLPVLFLCENNLYAMGTRINRYESQTEIAAKARGYGMPGEGIDGMDVLAVQEAMRKAVDWTRAGKGPYLLEFKTYRFRAHSMYDPELYRNKEEVERWKEHGPIKNFEGLMREWKCLTDDDLQEMEAGITQEIDEAVAFAEVSTWEPVEDLTKDVYTRRSGVRG
jgi:pyruvate dehydrogenase E1 component alpha subunit